MRYLLAVALLLAACGASDPVIDLSDTDPAVVERIESLSDCAAVQAQFDIASTNNATAEPQTPAFNASLAYMQVADARLRELGCYD